MTLPDTTAITKLTCAEEYPVWRSLVTMHFSPDLLDDSDVDMPARHIILTTVNMDIARYLVQLKTAKEMWDALHGVYNEAATWSEPCLDDATEDLRQWYKLDPGEFKSFDSFIWAYLREFQRFRNDGSIDGDEEAMIILLEKLVELFPRADIFHRTIEQIKKGTCNKKTLPELIGWLCLHHRDGLCDSYGWEN